MSALLLVAPDQPVADLAIRLAGGRAVAAVVAGGQLLGLITQADLARTGQGVSPAAAAWGNNHARGRVPAGDDHRYPPPPSLEELGLVPPGAPAAGRRSGTELPGQFRFQLLAAWIAGSFPPCAVADVGGGGAAQPPAQRGRVRAEVVDPVDQPLPSRYRGLASGRRVRLGGEVQVPAARCRSSRARPAHDLLVALHAHGANLAVLETVAQAGSSCVVLPCCVVGEPGPGAGSWFMWLVGRPGAGPGAGFFALRGARPASAGFAVRGERPAG